MSSPKRLPPLSKMSLKQQQKRSGEKFIFSTIVPKPRKPIRKVNPEAEARRKAQRRKKHAAYRRSETFKVVQERAAGQCEFAIVVSAGKFANTVRCDETQGLEHHHKRYGRQFGGNERPEDMLVLCKQHHAFYESQHPTRRRS